MSSETPLIEAVFRGNVDRLREAREKLKSIDVDSKITASKKKMKGSLRVSEAQAQQARSLLAEWKGSSEDIISDRVSASWLCVYCDGPVEPDMFHCPSCTAFIGDPHEYRKSLNKSEDESS